MAAKFTTQIVSQKLDILLSHPVCMECFLMRSCVKDSKAKLAKIQEFLSTKYRPPKTTEWSGRLLRAMYYAEEFIDKFHLREARQRHEALQKAAWPLATLVSKYKLWRDLSILVNKMDELCNDQFLKEEAEGKSKNKPASSSSHASVPWQGQKLARLTSFWDRQKPTNLFCHKAKMEEIMEEMMTTGYREISIWGEQGVGKTFLARWAYGQAKYMGYEWRAWVHVSGSKDERELLYEILKQIDNLASDLMMDMGIEEIRSKLYKKLAEKKKVIIVLDDVLPSDEPILRWIWGNVFSISRGCTIATTQDYGMARFIGCTQIKLKNLTNHENQRMLAWKLHRGSARISKEEEDILKRCPGLPLYISLLGGFLSNAREHERVALAKEGSTMTLSANILQLSCYNLPVHLIPCFIYMALFPITFPIPTRKLVRLWLAEGLCDSRCYDIERQRMRQPEDVGESIIMELVDRNVIDVVSWRADGSPKACQMLTSLYDMIHPVAMSAGFLHKHAKSKSKDGQDRKPTSQQRQVLAQPQVTTKIRWLAEHTNIVTDDDDDVSYLNLDLGQVRSFLSFYLRRGILSNDINTFLRKITSKTGCSLLRVLDLEGVYKPTLDGMLHQLVLLRYLGLRSTMLDLLPSAVANLHHLETLDIKHTDITLLPSSLWKARSLRHLHLNWFYIDLKNILKACSNNVNALTQLQTLSRLVVGEVNEKLMRDHMDSLTTLTTLKLYLQRSGGDASGVAGKAIADWISFRLTNLQSLTFGVIPEDKPIKEDKTKKETKPTEEAEPTKKEEGVLPELSLAEQHHDLLELYLLGQLNKPIWTRLLPASLRVLTLSGSNLETDVMSLLGGILRHLRTFRLLANSFVGTRMMFAKDGFPSLKILKIWKLPHLQELIIQPGALLHLQELEFRCLNKMKNVEGIRERKELENICVVVKKGARDFVYHLWGRIGWDRGYLYERDDTETPGPSDDDEGDRDDKGETLYLHVEKEGRLPTDDAFMDDDFKNLLVLRQKLAENEGSQSMVDNFINLLQKNLFNLRLKSYWTDDYDKWRELRQWLDRHIKNQGRQVVDADFMDMLNLFRQFLNFRKRLYRL